MKFDRRSAIALIGAGAAAPAIARPAKPGAVRFVHGVASGDPSADGAVLWTRATPADRGHSAPIMLHWHVAMEPNGRPLRSGAAEARPARDFTVKVEVHGLKPGADYHYWFEGPGDERSAVGRFRTLPAGETPDLFIAVATCQLYGAGLFNAYDAMARLDRLDVVVHLGDYIYEYGTDGYAGEIARQLGRPAEPPREILSLDDYRRRHAQYKSDPDLQAAHARAAFICVWDDHESANDSWTGGAQNHQPDEGDWATRKAAAMQAYFEWMPIRDPAPGAALEAINRAFRFGDLASLLMVETRLLARSRQVQTKDKTGARTDYAAILNERARPDREMLGEGQRQWVERELAASVAAGQPWQIIGNQVVMARVAGPDLEKALGGEAFRDLLARLPENARRAVAENLAAWRAAVPMNLDSWDGYPAARERLYATFQRTGARPIVLSGDSHAFWANTLADATGAIVAAELGTSSITSPSLGDALPDIDLGGIIADANGEVLFCDQHAKGFILLQLTPGEARANYVAVSTVRAKPYETRIIARFAVGRSERPEKMRRVS